MDNFEVRVNIKEYFSDEELKEILEDEIRKHVRNCVGEVSVSFDKSRVLIGQMAKSLARDGVQELIPNFKELINIHIQEEISKLKLHDFFTENMGWRSTGNKLVNSVLSDNRALIDAKIKEIFKLIS